MKKAYLVTFEITTRVVVDSKRSATADFDGAVQKAIDKVAPRFNEYLIPDNAYIEEDRENPAGTYKSDGVQEITHFYSKMQELANSVIDETKSVMESAGIDSVELPKASDESVDWESKVTVNITEDFSGNVATRVVERVFIKDGILRVDTVDPDYCDEVDESIAEGLSLESLISIHDSVCNKVLGNA